MSQLTFSPDVLLQQYCPEFAIGYGSWVFKQAWYADDIVPMVDLILWVESPVDWHRRNIEKNQWDYSWLGSKIYPFIQNWWAEIYYNPYVDFEGVSLKYGVISIESIKQDLEEWTYLYVAGRMHKPVHYIREYPQLRESIRKNLEHAVRVALCFLPETFTKEKLFQAIAGISYMGDSRMKWFENGKKVSNIVSKNMAWFEKLYENIIAESSEIFETWSSLQQWLDRDILEDRVDNFPSNLQSQPIIVSRDNDLDIFRVMLEKWIGSIVNGPSKFQTGKGLITAWTKKSIQYVVAKRRKAKS